MDVVSFVKQNLAVSICVSIAVAILLIFICKIDGFVGLLKKLFGMLLQQVCSLAIEAVCLVFKIVNSLEIYIVLLIDALTGKASSNGKIASLAIGVLSIASFYTTYSGMQSLAEQKPIAFLITLGIQAILLSTSLRINDVLNLDADIDADIEGSRSWGILALVTGIICILACLVAYVLRIFNMSFSAQKAAYHILYLIVILSILIIVFALIMKLIQTGIPNHNAGVLLLVIYFAVLSVSSFFSYNAFVPIMYPDSVRNIDNFRSYRLETLSLLERADRAVDVEYYENIKKEIDYELQRLETELERVDDAQLLSPSELEIYNRKNEYEKYILSRDELVYWEGELQAEKLRWEEEKKLIYENSDGIGPNTRKVYTDAEQEHNKNVNDINTEIKNLHTQINDTSNEIINNVDAYNEIVKKLNDTDIKLNCEKEIDQVRLLLRQNELSETEEIELSQAIHAIENTRLGLQGIINDSLLTNNLWDMVKVYRSYQIYRNKYKDAINLILGVEAADQGAYQKAYGQIELYVRDLLKTLPDTEYAFYDEKDTAILTTSLPRSDYYSTLETLRRNTDPGLSQIEKNIRTFVDNKLVGIICSSMALLIDMMILFVGIILPKNIHIQHGSNGKYSEQDVRMILSNLFNKPISRR